MSTKKSSKKAAKQGAKPRAKSGAKSTAKLSAKTGTKPSAKHKVKKTAAAAKAKGARAPKHAPAKAARRVVVPSASEFMAYAYAMEAEAAERYAEFADAMEVHNNREVAELFRKLSRIEQIHADQILEQMGWKQAPDTAADVRWQGAEGPETADPSELHYLMQPYHALQIALHNEKRARDFFAHLARTTGDAGVRAGALEMKEEEAEHVRLIEAWIKRTPVPEAGWAADLDPPVLSD